MLTDALLLLSNAQAVTSTAVSTNTIDLGVARDVGAGEELNVVILVDESATASGSATVTFELITSASSDLSSPNVISATTAIGKASLTAGRAPINLPIPVHLTQELGQRYFGVRYTVATGPLTAGKFTAQIVGHQMHQQKNYPSGYSVL